jgi:FAD/FMN-containing dehydrogenase
MALSFDGQLLRRGDPDYEAARRGALWNARTPERFPAAIVRAHSERDVLEAVRLAGEEGKRITLRSGGHSWAGNHLREDCLLIDMLALGEIELDAPAMRASVQPGRSGDQLLARLAEHDLFFPAGHCPGVGIGGYLLQGGYGWNGRVHGPACMSVEAIDVVLADGSLVRTDEHQHPELLWAARGSGPGFFGAVTRLHLRLTARPKVVVNAIYLYPIELLEEVFTWAQQIAPQVHRTMELMIFIHRDENGELEIALTGPVLVDEDEQARAALAVLESCPLIDRAKLALGEVPGQLSDLYAGAHAAYPDEHRYAADNMWTHAPVSELLPGLWRIAQTLPRAPSHMLWMNWGPGATPAPARPDMAYSLEDDTYIALYGVWEDPAEDERNCAWVTERMREMEHLSSGIQLADENLAQRPAPFMSEENMRRLRLVRDRYDPQRRFHSWMATVDGNDQ